MTADRPDRPVLSVVHSSDAPATERRPKHSDLELLGGVRRGDPGMAEDFYWRVKPAVSRTVRRLLGRLDQDGEDITQITMIQLIEALPRYRGECSLDAWVSAVSANVIYKHIRRRRLERSLFVGMPLESEPVRWGAASPRMANGEAQAREVTARIGHHLAAMNPNRAWAFLLHDVCGYSLDEIAQICRISEAAAQSRLSRGRRQLHECIRADPSLADLLDRELFHE